ncbi:AIR synthase family protein [Chakrabartyella piscis]|uniref:AIR synthase family protein n=1 Tax=Chakrabartyella piscis TaxID=2918914 RepID=UPI0029586AB7|nr:AIR synthase family protein [Chakrabartyella piscis]
MFAIGKIPPKILEKLVMQPISEHMIARKEVVLRPNTGEDCSAVDFGDEICVMSTDPITGATKDVGYLAVQINCNDIYSSGAEPVGVLLTVLMPVGSTEGDLEDIMSGALCAAGELGVEILGGHTEVTDAVNRPVVSVSVLGKTRNRNLIATAGAQVGDDLVMTKFAGLEGTAIIAEEYSDWLGKFLDCEEFLEAKKLKEMLSVGRESEIAYAHGVNAMHDVTEGGVFGAVWEMAECSKVGVSLFIDEIPIKDITVKICKLTEINPFGLISSGSMIIATKDGAGLVAKLQEAGIPSAVIGVFTENRKIIVANGEEYYLTQPQSDELYRVRA